MTDVEVDEFAGLRAEIAALRAEVAALKAKPQGRRAKPATDDGLSRRALLARLGGAAAAGVGMAAAGSALAPQPAGATTGAMQFGTGNNAGTDQTSLNAQLSGAALNITNSQGGGSGLYALAGSSSGIAASAAVIGDTSNPLMAGVIGTNVTGPGVTGRSSSNVGVAGTGGRIGVRGVGGAAAASGVGDAGVFGTSTAHAGVAGSSDTDSGVSGVSRDSYGVVGSSDSGDGVFGVIASNAAGVHGTNSGPGPGVLGESNGIGVVADGDVAPLLLVPHASAGPPTGPDHRAGEIVIDNRGDTFVCAGAPSEGAPPTWRQVSYGALGSVLVLGADNNAGSSQTSLRANKASVAAFNISNSASNGSGVYALGGASSGIAATGAVIGDTQSGEAGVIGVNRDQHGVVGVSGSRAAVAPAAAGVWGTSAAALGVLGSSGQGIGVTGSSDTSFGVFGESNSGVAVLGFSHGPAPAIRAQNLSGVGIGIEAVGAIGARVDGSHAQLLLIPRAGTGAPIGGSHEKGELILDADGNVFVCTAAGSPGTWRQVSYGTGPAANSFLLGADNDAGTATSGLHTNRSGGPVLNVVNTGANGGAVAAVAGTAASASPETAAVTGSSQALSGVAGVSDSGFGVYGKSASSPGVVGISTTNVGVNALAGGAMGAVVASNFGTGPGVTASASSGVGLRAHGGLAQLLLDPATGAGAPTGDTHSVGEIVLDRDANVFVCTAAGTPGSWKQVSYGIPDALRPGVDNDGGTTSTGIHSSKEHGATLKATNVDGNGQGIIAIGGAASSRDATAATAGVVGDSAPGVGVMGSSDRAQGVIGLSRDQVGVQGNGGTFGVYGQGMSAGLYGLGGRIGVVAEGVTAQLQLRAPANIAHGAPTGGTHERGEVFLDSDGNVFVCTAPGSPGTWKQVTYGTPMPGGAAAAGFVPIDPVRIIDTRDTPPNLPGEHALGTGEELTVDVAGVNGVPSSATAVVVNVTAVAPTADGYLSLYPAHLSHSTNSQPSFSNVNFTAGTRAVPNLAVVRLGASGPGTGKLKVFNKEGTTHVVLDVAGYYG